MVSASFPSSCSLAANERQSMSHLAQGALLSPSRKVLSLTSYIDPGRPCGWLQLAIDILCLGRRGYHTCHRGHFRRSQRAERTSLGPFEDQQEGGLVRRIPGLQRHGAVDVHPGRRAGRSERLWNTL